VTGANGGLGLEVTRELARKGAYVVMAARRQANARAAHADVLDTVPGASLELVELDLGSLASVRASAGRILERHPRIDILVNNAGVMGIPRRETEDGFEMQFGVDHLGHFALTALLMPALLRSSDGRVVSVTSTGRHFGPPVDPEDPHMRRRYSPWRAYGQAKLANVHFALELQRRFEQAGVSARSIVVHPGFTNTDLQARSMRESGGLSQRFFHAVVRRTGMTPARGALSLLRAATDPDARGGELYTPRFVNHGPPVRRPLLRRSRNLASLRTLWEVSERETGVTFDVKPQGAGGAAP
jgi:NAD(P)-dependent dehydrogenase (short-subunit alcohol dehydrogenase family)